MKQNKILLSSIFISLILFVFMAGSASAETATFVNLGTAGDFAVLSKVAISSSTETAAITGDIGVSPAAHTFITGFSLIGDETTDTFLTSTQVTGKVYSANLQPPTPAKMTTAISDMELAYTAALDTTANPAGTGPFLNVGEGTIIAQTLTPGVYTWDTSVDITDDLTLDCQGDTSAVFVFQIAQNLEIDAGKQIILIDCQNSNIFWAVAGTTDLLAGSHFEGTILGGPATSEITVITGSTINGRLLGEKTIALQAATVITMPVAAPATPVVTTITVTSASLTVGATQQLNVTSLDQFSAPIVATMNYTSNDTAVATVDASGLVTAVAPGTATITATSGAVSGSADMTVTPAAVVSQASSGGSGGGSSGGGSGSPIVNWQCGEYSACNAEGIRTKTCTNPNGLGTSTVSQTCTVTQTEVASPGTTVAAPTTESTSAPTVGNEITGQVVSDNGFMPPVWVTALALAAVAGLGIGGYYYFRKPE